jgi:hypothetical protein
MSLFHRYGRFKIFNGLQTPGESVNGDEASQTRKMLPRHRINKLGALHTWIDSWFAHVRYVAPLLFTAVCQILTPRTKFGGVVILPVQCTPGDLHLVLTLRRSVRCSKLLSTDIVEHCLPFFHMSVRSGQRWAAERTRCSQCGLPPLSHLDL